MIIDNLPRGDIGRQVRGRVIVQGRGYHNINNEHNISGGGYQINRAEFKFILTQLVDSIT